MYARRRAPRTSVLRVLMVSLFLFHLLLAAAALDMRLALWISPFFHFCHLSSSRSVGFLPFLLASV